MDLVEFADDQPPERSQPERSQPDVPVSASAHDRLTREVAASRTGRRLAHLMRPIVWCQATDPIRDVARRITIAAHSCALVHTAAGLGIVTDHDFRHRVATGEVGVDAPITALATVPALTIDADATQATGLLQMIEHAVHHLVVTDRVGRPVGVVRVVDLARAELRDPLLIRSAIETASTLDALAEAARLLPATIVQMCDSRITASHIGAVRAAVVDAITRRVIDLRPDPVLAEVEHSWVVLGSTARREPLPESDVDTAMVWAAPPDPAPDQAAMIRTAAGAVLADLRRCGLKTCPSGTNADNAAFNRSRSEWVAAGRAWQHDPTRTDALLMSAMVADSRPLTNVPLGRALTEVIGSHTRSPQFLRVLLDEALRWRPPTGFVRDFVVHHSGEHRGQLDLKRGGLAPIVSLARWIAIVLGDLGGTTTERLARGARAGLLTEDEAHSLATAFEEVYSLLLEHEVAAIRTGATPTTFIAPKDLDTLTRRHLRESFRAITQVQTHVDEHWMTRVRI